MGWGKLGAMAYSVVGAAAPALNAVLPGLGTVVGSMAQTQSAQIQNRQASRLVKGQIAAANAANGAGQSLTPSSSALMRGINIPGLFPGLSPGRPATSSMATSMMQDGDEEDKRASLRADEALTTLVQGGSDDQVRKAARKNRASKKDIITHLQRVSMVDITKGEGGEMPLSPGDKHLLSNEIERIFRKKRHGGPIPKSVARFIDKGRTLARLFASAPRLVSAVGHKHRRRA